MAEFALGLTKTAVEGTVSKVKSAMDEEAKLKVRVQHDLLFITGEFQMMQSFLAVANADRARNNEVVRTWARQLRDLAFDVEDCVELVVHLEADRSALSWLWRVVPACVAPPRSRSLDEAVAEIQQLKARVQDVSQRSMRYSLITSDQHSAGASNNSTSPATSTVAGAPNVLGKVWDAAGKRRGAGDLRKLITCEGTDLQVISVWGTGDTGGESSHLGTTTSVIRKAYSDPEICQEFTSRAWVEPMHHFNPEEFVWSLLEQLYASSHHADIGPDFRTRMDAAELVREAKGRKYLVVLEQVSSAAQWDAVRMCLPDGGNGSRVVVSTGRLDTALVCTGEAYQVSELARFSDGQSLCAFFKKGYGRGSDICDLSWILKRRGVISVWGIDDGKSNYDGKCSKDGKSTLIDKVYTAILHKLNEFDGVEFEEHSWVNVPHPFDLNVFSRSLFLDFHSDNLPAKKMAMVGMMGETGLMQWCREFLREHDCLVVVNHLRSTGDWDLIKATFLSEPTKGSVIVTANEESVATHCVDHDYRALNVKDLEADASLLPFVKESRYHGMGTQKGRFFSGEHRQSEAREWTARFGRYVCEDQLYRDLTDRTRDPAISVVSLWGAPGTGKSLLVRKLYYERLSRVFSGKEKYSWVDVPCPFDLTELCCRLLLDFCSDDFEAKDTVAASVMGGGDPVQGCREFLREHHTYLVVIDGLRSAEDWDLIQKNMLPETMDGCIIVVTNESTVAMHCAREGDRVFHVSKGLQAYAALPSLTKERELDTCNQNSDGKEEFHDWTNKFELVGHQNEVNDLMQCLQFSGVTSVWGNAGVGKSTIVKTIYYGQMLHILERDQYWDRNGLSAYKYAEGFERFSWVDMPHLFDLVDFCRDLLMDFHGDDLQAKETAAVGIMKGQDPIQECCRFMRKERCFVVVDGLRSTEDWDMIKDTLLSEPIKGCIVVITNKASIATYCAHDKDRVVNIKCLEEDDAIRLFTKIACSDKKPTSSHMELSQLTIAKSGGLSQVIAAIGEVSKQYDEFFFKASTGLLESLRDDFMGTLETHPAFHILRGLFSWMQSHLDACSDSLKPCLFYLSVFPLDQDIRPRRLLRRWVAEGYSRDRFGSTADEDAERLFSELVNLSIIQKIPSRKVLCQVNGFFREYIVTRPMEDNLVFALEARCSPNSQRVGQHLTVGRNWDRDKIVFESIDFTRLRSLTVFGEWRSFFISPDMKLLRVLDLEDTEDLRDEDLDKIEKLPPRLKFFSLRGCRQISHLPGSLGGMRQLQTLDVRHTKIVKLPLAIVKLEKLQYIRAGTTVSSVIGEVTVTGLVETTTTTPLPEANEQDQQRDGDVTRPILQEAAAGVVTPLWSRQAHDFVSSSWLSKKLRRGPLDHNGGVEIPSGVGKLTALRTLGVVNIAASGGKAFLEEVKKLTQLRKLGVSGVNRGNWLEFCSTVSGHGHLESLSVQLDDEDTKDGFACLDDISEPPKTLRSLKVHGRGGARVRPVWITQLRGLQKAGDLELTISGQEDIDCLPEWQPRGMVRRLRVRPARDGELNFYAGAGGWSGGQNLGLQLLEINCCSRTLEVAFREWIPLRVEQVMVRCSSGSALRLSGLEHLQGLKEVWLRGTNGDAIEQHLLELTSRHPDQPAFKLER